MIKKVAIKKEEAQSRQRQCFLPDTQAGPGSPCQPYMLMIRLFSVLCKLKDIKRSDREWYEDTAGTPPAPQTPCPFCQAKGYLRLFGHYKRYLVEWDGHAQKTNTIIVSRYICDLCGHTHALLPSCIVPYRSYSLRFLLTILRSYYTRACPVEQICSRYGITVSMLYRIVQLFGEQKALWLGVLEDAAVSGIKFIDLMEGAFVRDFFSAFCFSFLGRSGGTDLSLGGRKGHHRSGIT